MVAIPAKPVPQRMPPLRWRDPALLWTPVALAIAIGWPAALFNEDPGMQRLASVAGAIVFAIALVSLGLSWAVGRAPRTRRTVVMHIVIAGAVTAIAAPYVLTQLLATVADHEHEGAGANFTVSMSAAMTPLALVLGLPISLISGLVFAWVALMPPRRVEPPIARHDVQPFQ